jgi:stringent starvation protein B
MYTYRIFAYQAVQAVKYSYSDVKLYPEEGDICFSTHDTAVDTLLALAGARDAAIAAGADPTAALPNAKLEFNAIFKSDIKIIEVPLYSQKVRILDSGPLSPEVQIIPLKDSPDTIHIMLNNRVGREDLDPIILVPESDTELFTTQAEAQRLVPGNKMTFESEDRPSKFQIFRTKTRPTEWSDFGDNLHLELDTAVSSVYDITTVDKSFGTNNYAHAAAVRDNVEANTKYYYTFRTVDVHGFISNPTEIYQVELVNNDGTTYLLIEAVDFALKVPKQSTRHFRRYLKIAPKITQVMVDTEKYDSAWDAKSNGMNLGVQDIPVWGKEFKIIIRSKKTGREAHLYTTFNQTHNKTTTELGDPTVEDSST